MNKIYVFTATGNSLAIAKELGAKLGSTEVVSIGALMQNDKWKIEGDNVGFVFPCYYGTMPQIVKRFIAEAASITANYFFGFASAGGGIGYSLKHLDQSLKLRGKELHYGRSTIIAGNYMNGWYYSMIQSSKEQIQINIETTKNICKETVAKIKKRERYIENGKRANYILPNIISPNRYIKDTRPWDKEFSAGDLCNGCETCVKVCPVQNIHMKEGKPSFLHNCQRCMACIQLCPKQSFFIQGKPMNKERYRHPDISVKELIKFQKEIISFK